MKKILSLMCVLLLLCGCAKEMSKNEDAKSYSNGKCVVFYPDNERIKEYAESLCEDGEENVIDYRVIPAGDFDLVSYPDGLSFYTEKDHSEPALEVRDRLDILSSELRYQMRKDGIDEAYTSGFFIDTAKDTIEVSDVTVRIDNDDLCFYFPGYDYEVKLPMSLGQQIVGRSFGMNDTEYVKRRYVDPDRPMVALTFDDGPYKTVDSVIYEIMERYDARCTFYFVGSRLSERELENSLTGIELGCEYGSHTENHENLAEYDAYAARDLVYEVSDYFYEKLGYQMKTYRPPFGSRNMEMEDIIDMPAILWNVDSEDWRNRDTDVTYSNVINTIRDGGVVLLHSLYESTGEACRWIVPELMDMGYQLVTVSELMEYLGVQDQKFFRGQ